MPAWRCCSRPAGSGNDGTLEVGLIESEEELFADGIRLAPGAQHLRGAVRSGLVALDENGDVVPALADRWNVTDDGRIFVFRLRDGNWPDGSELSAESARLALNNAIRSLRGTSLGLDLLPIAEIRAMAGRVIEIRTTSAVPHLLQILAQPELALRRDELETGVMLLQREDGRNLLHMRPPQERGLPEEEDWQEHVREVELFPMTSQAAIEAFDDGEVQVVLGGSVGDFPLVDTGPLSRGTVRLDPAIGLFGLQVLRARGMLESDEVREAVAMAIDREALMERFNIGGWVPTTRVVAPELPGDPGIIPERWEDQPIEELRQTARTRVSRWVAAQEGEVTPETTSLAVLIGTSPGHDMLFRELADQLATIGITLVHAEDRNEADLVLGSIARPAMPVRAGSSTSSTVRSTRACAMTMSIFSSPRRSTRKTLPGAPICWPKPRPN